MKRIVTHAAVALVALGATTGAPLAASGGAASDYARAYDYALRCFVVNEHDEAAAKTAYDAALRLGRLQGKTDAQITRDFRRSMATESVRLARSPAYREQLLADCRKLGMAH